MFTDKLDFIINRCVLFIISFTSWSPTEQEKVIIGWYAKLATTMFILFASRMQLKMNHNAVKAINRSDRNFLTKELLITILNLLLVGVIVILADAFLHLYCF